MKRVVLVALCILGTTAHADDLTPAQRQLISNLGEATSGFSKDHGVWRFQVNRYDCDETLTKIAAAKIPETVTFKLPYNAPDLPAGDYPWPKAAPLCPRIKLALAIQNLVGPVDLAAIDTEKTNGPPDSDLYRMCLMQYKNTLAAGVAETEMIFVHDQLLTIKEAKEKWCTAGKAKFDVEAEKRQAPYKKALKGDKLDMALVDPSFVLPGGAATIDAKKLAAASVWFRDTMPDSGCANGAQAHVVHRYQFDGKHKLVKTTDKSYCGNVPASAYR
jgi:hypothetical protein